jgi:acetyl-CoA synthetase
MARDLSRLLRPKSIAVIGGGAWGEAVIKQAQMLGFSGNIYPVHPSKTTIAGLPAVKGAPDLPEPPDAVFVGINRDATVGAVERLARMGAGGAVCFASGFAEAQAEDANGTDVQQRLLAAAGDMPILGPNCYGFINALDGAILWPDQHGMTRVDRGVAILTQSSNIAINLTMQQRHLPIAYMVTCGNMAQSSMAEIATTLLDDNRVTAIGFHIEGFTDLRAWEALAQTAAAKNIPLVALKVGKSAQAQAAAVSHTASLAGGDAGAGALLARLGIGRVKTLPELLEALKLLHVTGPLKSHNIASISCSGGEASLAADLSLDYGVGFPPLNDTQASDLRAALGPKVALANPLDYHTYIWRDQAAMASAWAAINSDEVALTMSIVDYPTTDATDWTCATGAAIDVQQATGGPVAITATLSELMPSDVAQTLMNSGVAPMQGLSETLAAVSASVTNTPENEAVLLPSEPQIRPTLSEHQAKTNLTAAGLDTPNGVILSDRSDLPNIAFPVVAKVMGLAHKSGENALALNIADQAALAQSLQTLRDGPVRIEEMITGALVELLVGVVKDPAHGFVLTVGAGGTLTELMSDTTSVLIPASRDTLKRAIEQLRIYPVLTGYRSSEPIDLDLLLDTLARIQTYVTKHAETLEELEINPLICTKSRCVVADALIRQDMP